MLPLFLIRAACFGKSCSFGLLYVSIVEIISLCVRFNRFWLEGGMWNLMVLVPDH